MPKKTKHESQAVRVALADAIRESLLQIWQAGLGAFSEARQEGGKLFAKLARDGAKLQDRGRELACDSATELAQSAKEIAGAAGRQASGSLRTVETRLQRGVGDALYTLGVPVRRDLHDLIERVERLSATVNALGRERAAAAESSKAATGKQAARAVKGKSKSTKVPAKAPAKRRAGQAAANRV